MKSNKNIDHIVGQNLRKLRLSADMSQADIAKLLGVTYQQIQKYEAGRNSLSIDKLAILKAHFSVPFEYFTSSSKSENNTHKTLFDADSATLRLFYKLSRIKDKDLQAKIGQIVDILTA